MSEEKSHKGLSLRRKKASRPAISAPRQISQPILQETTVDRSRWDAQSSHSREARPSIGNREHTSDLVKRRYSARFTAAGPQDSLAPPVPAVPNLPAQYTQTTRIAPPRSPSVLDDRSQERNGEPKVKVDLRILSDPNLSAESYVQQILADASESDIRAYQNELEDVKTHTNLDLQHNVYQNRTQLIKISKEADKLKSEMQTLRTLMSELTGTLGSAATAGSSDAFDTNQNMTLAERKRANRSSVASLEAMWSTHLQVLWKRVEGSQKHLPALPGRHIILESQRWVELNSATWKPRRRVALVLLNDHLLVASEKKRNDLNQQQPNNNNKANHRQSIYSPGAIHTSPSRFVAERCWPLQDVSLADISRSATSVATDRESKTIANAIHLRAGNESYTYAITDAAEKASIIVAFRKAQEDLRKHLIVEQGLRERRSGDMSYYDNVKTTVSATTDASETSDPGRNNMIIMDGEGRQQSLRWVDTQIDGLDIDIALQSFDEAVDRVEQLRKLARGIKGNATAQDIIFRKINERAAKLANNITRQLVISSAKMEQTKINVAWLLRLGYEEMARTRYLQARTDAIALRTRQLPFTGAIVPFLHALAFTTFTLLLNTFRNFSSSFPAVAGSAVVRWAKERVDDFNTHLERQLSGVDRNSALWNECMTTVHEHADVLKDVGVDFKALIGRNLSEDPKAKNAASRTATPQGLGVST